MTTPLFVLAMAALGAAAPASPKPVFHEPQVRYLLADLHLGGNPATYRKYAVEEKDPDSARALVEWEAGVRLLEPERYEAKRVEFPHGGGRRIVYRGTTRTVPGHEILLTSDRLYDDARLRYVIADLTLGGDLARYRQQAAKDATVGRALSYWDDGARATNTHLYEARGDGRRRALFWRGLAAPLDGSRVALSSDPTYDEARVRYILADLALGAAPEFYRKVADSTHDPFSIEALARWDAGYRVLNAAELERKRVDGKTLITRRGSTARVDGSVVRLSSDPPPGTAPQKGS